MFLYAGVGLAASGIVTILLISQEIASDNAIEGMPEQERDIFKLEEIHASPNIVMHVHANLVLVRNGEQLEIPKEIGISPDLWHDHSLDNYGPSSALLAPMHTHDTSGTIHIESTVDREYTLGEFLKIWGMDSSKIIKVTDAGGNDLHDYENHVLSRNEKLELEIRA